MGDSLSESIMGSKNHSAVRTGATVAQTGIGIKLNRDDLAETVFMEHDAALRFFNRMSAGGLLILAWEHVRSKHRGDPMVQFLRHCRNAAAHNGVFTFERGQPDKPAEWRTLSIVRTMRGELLFADPPRPGFLGIGDGLYLLADIEKKFYRNQRRSEQEMNGQLPKFFFDLAKLPEMIEYCREGIVIEFLWNQRGIRRSGVESS